MMDISAPLTSGDIIEYFLDGSKEVVSEKIIEGFWEKRPKGGKEYCYKTESGTIVPLSKVLKVSCNTRPILNGSIEWQMESMVDFFSDKEQDQIDVYGTIESSELPNDQKEILLLVLQDDIESLGLAKSAIENKLNYLRKCLSEE